MKETFTVAVEYDAEHQQYLAGRPESPDSEIMYLDGLAIHGTSVTEIIKLSRVAIPFLLYSNHKLSEIAECRINFIGEDKDGLVINEGITVQPKKLDCI